MELTKTVEQAKTGDSVALLELWEAVKRFVEVKAKDCAARSSVPLDDLRQEGFFAVVDAVAHYDSEREGGSFLALLSFTLRKQFASAMGVRSSKRDALQYSDSIDAPAFPDGDNTDGPTIGDGIPDSRATLALFSVEYSDFMIYCRGMIEAALNTLTERQADLMRCRYLCGQSLEDAAFLCGFSGKQAASEAEHRALTHIERGKYSRELRECLSTFGDFHTLFDASQRETWRRTGTSRTEAAAIMGAEGVI